MTCTAMGRGYADDAGYAESCDDCVAVLLQRLTACAIVHCFF